MSNIPLLRPTYNYNGNLPAEFEPVYAVITTRPNHGSQYTPMFVVDMFRFDSNEKVLAEQLYHDKIVPTEWVQGKWSTPPHTSIPNAHYALANRIATIFSILKGSSITAISGDGYSIIPLHLHAHDQLPLSFFENNLAMKNVEQKPLEQLLH